MARPESCLLFRLPALLLSGLLLSASVGEVVMERTELGISHRTAPPPDQAGFYLLCPVASVRAAPHVLLERLVSRSDHCIPLLPKDRRRHSQPPRRGICRLP